MNDVNLNELLAFELGQLKGHTLEEWQESLDLRNQYRQNARLLVEALGVSGARFRISNTSRVEERLRHIRTWQPRPAYDLSEAELPETTPSTEDVS